MRYFFALVQPKGAKTPHMRQCTLCENTVDWQGLRSFGYKSVRVVCLEYDPLLDSFSVSAVAPPVKRPAEVKRKIRAP